MKILVCFKVLPNPEGILPEDFENFNLQTDLSYAGYDYNCFDASALEIGLKIKNQGAVWGQEVTCTALSVSNKISPKFAQSLYSVGYDNVVCLKLSNREFKPKEVARIISDYAKKQGADLVLTGAVSGFAETGMVPYYIAENLSYPIISDLEKAELKDGSVCCYYRKDGSLYEGLCKMPAVMAVNNSPEVLRFSTLKERLLCKDKTAKVLEIENADESIPKLNLLRPDTGRSCEFLDNSESSFNYIFDILKSSALSEKDDKKEEKALESGFLKENSLLISVSSDADYCFNEVNNYYEKNKSRLLILSDNHISRILAIRLSNKFNLNCLFCGKIDSVNSDFVTVKKRVYSSNLEWTYNISYPAIVTVKETEYEKLSSLKHLKIKDDNKKPDFLIDEKLIEKADKSTLKDANVVIICGNGLGNKVACDKARELSQKLGCGFGLTRPAALNAWGSPNEIVGQSGSILSADVAITLGVSGAGAFMQGVENCKKIIAVNTDSNALVFKNADIGIKMDASEFIEKINALIK